MPKGLPNARVNEIEGTDLQSRGGLRGRIDRLFREYTLKAQALRITAEILDADDRQQALESAPKKFLQAMNMRPPTVEAPHLPLSAEKRSANERLADITDFLSANPSATTQQVADAIGVKANRALVLLHRVAKISGSSNRHKKATWTLRASKSKAKSKGQGGVKKKSGGWHQASAISGSRLTLFLLEHLNEDSPTTMQTLAEDLAEAGSPLKSIRNLNGPLAASFKKAGYAVRHGDGYIRTAKGSSFALTLRETLEANGTVPPGGYLK